MAQKTKKITGVVTAAILVVVALLYAYIANHTPTEPWDRGKVIAWAKNIGKDERWVDQTFQFEPQLRMRGEVDLSHSTVTRLPDGIVSADNLNLSHSQFSNVRTLPEDVNILDLSYTPLQSLRGFRSKNIRNFINISSTHLTSLEGLPITVGGLAADSTTLTTLKGMPQFIKGELQLEHTPITNLEGFPLAVDGPIFLASTPLRSLIGLPETIHGDLHLWGTQLSSLEGMPREVEGDLLLMGAPLTSLEGLPKKIAGDLRLLGVPATSLPSDLAVNGSVWLTSDQKDLARSARNNGYKVKIYDGP